MPKKSKKKNKHFRSWNPKKWLMAGIYLLVIAAIVCLYAFQPNKKRLEINRLASVYMHGGSNIGMMQILRDVWSVYSTKGLVPCDIRPADDLPVYGGIPRYKTQLTILRNDAYWVGYSEELKHFRTRRSRT